MRFTSPQYTTTNSITDLRSNMFVMWGMGRSYDKLRTNTDAENT